MAVCMVVPHGCNPHSMDIIMLDSWILQTLYSWL